MRQERKCYVCGAPDEVDRHHVLPVEYGGPKDGKTVDLCTRHHRLVHRAAESYYGTGEYTKNYHRLPDSERQRADVLIRYILHAKGEHEASGKSIADDARNMVQVSCSPEELMLFHAVKKQMGMRSLARTIKVLMMQQYQNMNGVNYAATNSQRLCQSSPDNQRREKRQSQVRDKKKAGRQHNRRSSR